MSVNERFWSKVDKLGDCWVWTGAKTSAGYGNFFIGTRRDPKYVPAHRYAFEVLKGPIPAGLDLDHLCRNRACVKPTHLEPVTRRENLRRSPLPNGGGLFHAAKTHCPHGHPYDETNTRIVGGKRICITCRREQGRRSKRERRVSA